ncbi:hypothetical protein GCM10010464_75360 [Pseudonocardia yunnanensis]
MGAGRVRDAVLRAGQVEAQLGAERGAYANLLGGFGQAHHVVQAVVVGQRDGVDAHPGVLLGQFLRVAGAVEEAEVGAAVRVRATGGELKLFTLPDAVRTRLDSPVQLRQ